MNRDLNTPAADMSKSYNFKFGRGSTQENFDDEIVRVTHANMVA